MTTFFSIIPNISAALSSGGIFGYYRLVVGLQLFAIRTKISHSNFKQEFNFQYRDLRFTLSLCSLADLSVLKEIFVDKEYEWFPEKAPKVIIDLGAHFGDTALYYHAHFPDAKIVAVEPSPENYARLVHHTKHIPNIIPVQAAVGAKDGEITLHLMNNSLGHSVMDRENSETTVIVRQISLPTLYKEFNITRADMIKFDIEGAEFDLFKSIGTAKYAEAYIGELHFDLTESYSLDWIDSCFKDFKLETYTLSNKNRFILKAKV